LQWIDEVLAGQSALKVKMARERRRRGPGRVGEDARPQCRALAANQQTYL